MYKQKSDALMPHALSLGFSMQNQIELDGSLLTFCNGGPLAHIFYHDTFNYLRDAGFSSMDLFTANQVI